MRQTFAVFGSHYSGLDMAAVSKGYVEPLPGEPDNVYEEVAEPTTRLASSLEESIVPHSLDL